MATPKLFQVPATLEGVSTLKDGGVTVRFHTQELDVKQKQVLFDFQQQFGWLQFSSHEIQNVPSEKLAKVADGKSRAQSLRAVLYILYKQSGRTDISFDEFYIRRMTEIINQIKARLEPKG